jgi:hypothetical protein
VSKDPHDRIRTTSVLALVGLALVARDLLRIRRWAGAARQLERVHAQANAKALNDLEEHHLERARELQSQVDKLLDELERRSPVEPVDEPGE